MEALQDSLGYQFRDHELLEQALTHPSRVAEQRAGGRDYQRLEFLGDAVLQLVLTERLFLLLPDEAEGGLTKTRANLVSKGALAECARRLGVGNHLQLGKGEEASGGRERESNLADALEALVGAVYLDGGLEAVGTIVREIMAEDLEAAIDGADISNPKGQLQEVLQSIDRESPVYRIVDEAGPDHLKQFEAEVTWRGISLGAGRGSSKKAAEAKAARRALDERLWLAETGESGGEERSHREPPADVPAPRCDETEPAN